MNLIELEKQIEKNKIISAFKDGVVDGLMHGIKDEIKSHHYYNLGYDFGITLYSQQIDEEWICDGCGNTFDKTELVDSIQPPYYSCVDCEEDLIATTRKEDMEKLNDN